MNQANLKTEYLVQVQDLLSHPLVQSMGGHISHGRTTVLDHCLAVSYLSYKLSSRLRLDSHAAARAGLLHDFYLYDWHDGHDYPGLHGPNHPAIAHRNAVAHFDLSPIESDCILRHMWPLTLRPPMHRLSWVVCLADKACAIVEIVQNLSARWSQRGQT